MAARKALTKQANATESAVSQEESSKASGEEEETASMSSEEEEHSESEESEEESGEESEGSEEESEESSSSSASEEEAAPAAAPIKSHEASGEASGEAAGEKKEEKTIFVKGLSYSVTEEDLRRKFEEFGEIVEIRIPRSTNDYNKTDKGKGFGYIEFADVESCEKSMALNGEIFEGRALVVDMAKGKPPRREGSESTYEPRQARPGYNQNEISVFLGNIAFPGYETDHEEYQNELLQTLQQYARVKSVRLPRNPETNGIKGFGFASLDTMEEAEKLISSQLIFRDRPLRADISNNSSSGSRDGGFRGRFDNRPRDRDGGFRGGFNGGSRGGFGRNDSFREKRNLPYDNAENKGGNNKHVKFE